MKKAIVLFVLILMAALSIKVYSDDIQKDLQEGMVRLHIVANSDSGQDQAVKLMVRDAVLRDIKNKMNMGIENVNGDIKSIIDTANNTLYENGMDYTASANFGKIHFPEKSYKNLTLPEGEYNAVEIILGNGAGHNWWCVLYPPMCIMDDNKAVMSVAAAQILRKNLKSETYDIVTKNDKEVVVKFKVVEIVQKLKAQLIG